MRMQQAEEATHAPTQQGDEAACSSCMLGVPDAEWCCCGRPRKLAASWRRRAVAHAFGALRKQAELHFTSGSSHCYAMAGEQCMSLLVPACTIAA